MERIRLIGVIGSGACDGDVYERARRVGYAVGRAGFGVVCGGLGGVMEGACRGAVEAGALTVGILPGGDPADANPYVALAVPTGMGIARNVIVVRSAPAVVAVSGGPGTLSEIAHALNLGIPVVGLDTFDVSDAIVRASGPEEAAAAAVRLARARLEGGEAT